MHGSLRSQMYAQRKSTNSGRQLLGAMLLKKSGVADDVGLLVLQHLPSCNLVTCSMVCKDMRNLIDRSCYNIFARDLMWWGSNWDNKLSANEPKMHFDGTQFVHERTLYTPSEQILWRLNSRPGIDVIVRMRVNVFVAADSEHVHLEGDSKRVQKIMERGVASVDVLSWRITNITRSATKDSCIGNMHTVTLCAEELTINTFKVKINLSAPVQLILHSVPVQPDVDSFHAPALLHRCLWVMRGIRKCMHCHQRYRMVQSFDASKPDHRVLCSLCLDLLYAREAQLTRRWKVQVRRLPVDKVPRVHFVNCFMGAPTNVWPTKPERFVLKQSVAEFFDCISWTQFISKNHMRYHAVPRWRIRGHEESDRFLFNSRWF